jgi:GWxTD domain-containing protein
MKKLAVAVLLAAACLAGLSVAPLAAKAKLPAARREWLSKVGYIISKEERKIFTELPDTARDEFIAQFWKRRDPFPDTERNEFKIEYEDRVAKAETMFRGEGRPGWLTDRGRIFILFGPPSERLTFPMDSAGYCREIWYYGAFPVIFIDEHCSGLYVMTAINLEHLHELNIAQGYFQKTYSQDKKLFDYEVSMKKTQATDTVFEGQVFVDIPYDTIWFNFKEGKLETGFEVQVQISEPNGNMVWQAEGTYPFAIEEKDLVEHRTARFRIEFPLRIDKGLDRLKKEKLRMDVTVKSTTEGEGLKKTVSFQLKS